MSISVGLGSWSDPEYVGILYPKGLPPSARLEAYSKVFTRIEVNSSYYATPRASVVAEWVRQTPPTMIFDIKLHRAFSQSPEKTARGGSLPRSLKEGVLPLVKAQRLGVFLLVTAPSFAPERNRLEELGVVADELQPHLLAVELRDRGWVTGGQRARTIDYFRARGLVWVNVDLPRIRDKSIMPSLDVVTSDRLAYVRMHGRNEGWREAASAAERHAYDYPAREVRALAARLRKLEPQVEHVHAVANNHARDYAPKLALALRELLKL